VPEPSIRGSSSTCRAARASPANRSSRRPDFASRRSADLASDPAGDLAGRAVGLSPDVPAIFDAPLAPHHRVIGRWAAPRTQDAGACTRLEARRHIEAVFDAAVREILDPIDIVDLRIAVLNSEADGPPAIAIICDSMGQLDLGWIETGDAPTAWRAAAYRALEQTLGRVLPVFSYQDLFDEMSMYYWEEEIDDEAARRSLIECHGADAEDLDGHMLPSQMNERRPGWMIAANAAPLSRLPAALRRKLADVRAAQEVLSTLSPEAGAWHFDFEIASAYLPGIEECASLPPLTLVPFVPFARELDDVMRSGMEMGFMDIAGICPLPDVACIDDWFASLRLGAQFLLTVQNLVRFDPPKARSLPCPTIAPTSKRAAAVSS
jgi:hypothetical protein